MTARGVVRDLIVAYLKHAGDDRPVQTIIRYMYTMHRVEPGATRTALYRLVKDCRVRRVELGRYAHVAGGGDLLHQESE